MSPETQGGTKETFMITLSTGAVSEIKRLIAKEKEG
jgi:hypothetical protein